MPLLTCLSCHVFRHVFRHATRHTFAGVLLLSLLSALWSPTAVQAAAPDAGFQAAYAAFSQAVEGDTDAIDTAAQAFDHLAAANPGDPVLMAYAGASTALRAKAAWLPRTKMRLAEDGLAQIDQALALLDSAGTFDAPRYHHTPASLETRFVAASTFLRLPAMFNRQARGEKLLADVLGSPLLAGAPLPFQGAVWLMAGKTAGTKRPDDARRWLQRVVQAQAPQAAAAKAELQALGL